MKITRTTPVADLPELLKPKEFAAKVGCGEDHVYALIARGELKAVRLGRMLFVPRAVLEAMVCEHQK